MLRGSLRFVVTLVAIVVATDAFAQSAAGRRPYRGLFGGGMVENARQSLVFNGSLGGGWDDNILFDLPSFSGTDPRNAQRGSVGSLTGNLGYSASGTRASLGASVGTSSRYYPSQDEPFVAAHSGSIGGSVRLGRRTSLSGSQAVTYQPFTFASFLPSLAAPLTDLTPELGDLGASIPETFLLDQATGNDEYIAYMSQAAFNHQFSPRVGSYLSYNYQHSDTAFAGGAFRSRGGGGGISFRLSQGLFARVGYFLQETSLASGGRPARLHNADFGLNYNKALSFSRRTTVSFSSGTTGLSNGTTTSYQLIGGAALNHELGRSWNATAAYNRSVQLIDLLLQPVVSDSVQAAVQGLITRRVQAQAGFLAAIGTVGFEQTGPTSQYDTMQASGGISFALSRYSQVGVSYTFYRYDFDDTVRLPAAVPTAVDRQSVRAYVNLWAPIINKARR